MRNADFGWTKITHPFHPLREQRFRILKTRKVAGQDTLILQGTNSGTFAVPREWTDQADPCPYDLREFPAPILSFQCLRELVEIAARIGDEKNRERG
ncbi:MAG: hypothetical protein IMZ50_16055 [Candidatus Atribacteria bacterium]|nr:hypothetical protein [Candidatus Atribacteria bacterium]